MMNFRLGGGEVAIGNVDRDSLLPLGAKTVSELGKVDGGVAGDGADVVVVDVVRVVEQAADEGGLAVVHAAGGGEAEQSLASSASACSAAMKSAAFHGAHVFSHGLRVLRRERHQK